jgi:uncharacterized membrane protein YkvA (DUF1232 family)
MRDPTGDMTSTEGKASGSGHRKPTWIARLRQRAHQLEGETYALYLAARDPRTPWHAKLLVAGIVAYALSPIDLIPDFIPVVGYLDDLILVPLGITLAVKLIPPHVLADCRARAREALREGQLASRRAAAVIVAIWVVLVALCLKVVL